MANLLTFGELNQMEPESTVYLETKQTLRPAIFFDVIDRLPWLIDGEHRFAIHLMTPAKLTKHWEWRLYNKTWRLWDLMPSRAERTEVRWDA